MVKPKAQVIRSLIGHEDVSLGIVCLSSLMKNSVDPLELILHDDGTLNEKDEETLVRMLPNASILWRQQADEQAQDLLHNHPAALHKRRTFPLALKLLDVPLFSQSDICYCDTDVFFFRRFRRLFDLPIARSNAIFMSDLQNAYSLKPGDLRGKDALRIPQRINTGVFCIRRATYDLDFIDWFLAQERFFSLMPHWAEQTAWALLGNRVGCRRWCPRHLWLAHGRARHPAEIVAGHFTRPSRWMLPALQANLASLSEMPPVDIETIGIQACGPLCLGINQLRNKWGKWRHTHFDPQK